MLSAMKFSYSFHVLVAVVVVASPNKRQTLLTSIFGNDPIHTKQQTKSASDKALCYDQIALPADEIDTQSDKDKLSRTVVSRK
jgi:hypothetical protein